MQAPRGLVAPGISRTLSLAKEGVDLAIYATFTLIARLLRKLLPQKIDGTTVRRYDGTTARRCDGATARRRDGATARRCDGAAVRRYGGTTVRRSVVSSKNLATSRGQQIALTPIEQLIIR